MSIIKDSETEKKETPTKSPFYLGFLFFAGILLPMTSFLIELFSRWCATDLFDPMPTWWHAFFVLFVPVTNFQTWWAIRRGSAERLGWLGFANAVTIFIALFYSIIFAPVTPIAVIGIIFMLIGLLPLAPLFSLIAAIMMRFELRKLKSENNPLTLRWQGLGIGILTAFIALGLAELPLTLTKIGIQKANSGTIDEQNRGLDFLRKYGDRDYLLRLSYENSGMIMTDFFANFWKTGRVDVIQFDDEMAQTSDISTTKQAQIAFYRLTGKSYRQVPTPRGIKHWQRFENWDSVDETDSTRINQGLSLIGSQIDGSVDGDAALGYIEWTLTFKNTSSWQQEALSQIQLPPNAVVSRLTLWINGEEREAAFAKSAKVIEAYNAVTAKRRDPALLTTVGKDRVSLKCFPVPPNGEMKVRIGITTPLVLEDATNSLLPLPYFQDRNFAVPTEHAVWIESKKRLEIANPKFDEEQRENLFAVRGNVKNEELAKIGSPIRAGKSADIKIAWTKDKNNPQTITKQEFRESTQPKPARLVFVIDASAAMKNFQKETAEAIKKLAPETETAIILTSGNALNLENAAPNSFVGNPLPTAEIIEKADFEGGTDSVPAISKAWELAQAKQNSVIIWIHAPQAVEIALPKNLAQLWMRRPNNAPIYSIQTQNGKDVVDRVLNESNLVNTVPRFGSLQNDLSRLLTELNHQKQVFEAVRTIETNTKFQPSADYKETSQHLVRLWANDEIKRLLMNKEDAKATDLAVKNQLVTSVSGAVVLETQQQYDQFGLKPVDTNSVPTVPEPEEYLLFGVVLAILLWFCWERRQPCLLERLARR